MSSDWDEGTYSSEIDPAIGRGGRLKNAAREHGGYRVDRARCGSAFGVASSSTVRRESIMNRPGFSGDSRSARNLDRGNARTAPVTKFGSWTRSWTGQT